MKRFWQRGDPFAERLAGAVLLGQGGVLAWCSTGHPISPRSGAGAGAAVLFVLQIILLYGLCRRRARQGAQQRVLEGRLEAQAAALAAQTATLTESARMKDDFLAVLAHELRNPLNPILLQLGLSQRKGDDLEALKRLRDTVQRQAHHIARLIDDLSEVSRIAAGKVRLRPQRLELGQAVRELVGDHRKAVEDAGLTLAVQVTDTPLPVEVDPTRLMQVVSNLLGNAAKFTPPGGTITVVVSEQPETGLAALSVIDTGMGIEPEVQPRIFEMFSQLHRFSEPGRRGLGLGLSVVRRLVQLHGGWVSVYSEGLGCGATFTCVLPLREQVLGAAPAEPERAHDSA